MTQKSEKRRLFSKGFKPVLKKAQNNKYIKSCDSCTFFYEALGDKEELCQNPNVLEYDIQVDGNRVYCGWWEPDEPEKKK